MENDRDYLGLIRRAKEVAAEVSDVEEDLRKKAAGFFEPTGHPEFSRYIGKEVGEEELCEASEIAAEYLHSMYYLKIRTEDLAENLDAGRTYDLDGREVQGTTLKNRLRDIHRELLDEEETFIELAEDLEEYAPAKPLRSSRNDYSWEDLSNQD